MAPFLLDWPGGSLEATLKLGGLIIGAYALVLWFSAVVWVYRDVRNRTSDPISQTVAVLLVALFNLPGLVVYLVIRPQTTLNDTYERSLETEAILHELQLTSNACQNCQRPIEDDFIMCPNCRTILREGCRNCGRAVRTSWIACPYCGADRVQRTVPVARASAGPEPLQPPRRAAYGPTNGGQASGGSTASQPPVPHQG
jgi:RNA polymerase subunit RPABC4/transcription elongation factor Spt4